MCQRCFYTHSTTEIAQSFGLSRHQLRYRCLNYYQITPQVLIQALCLHHFIRLSAHLELKTQRNRFIQNHARMYLWRLTRDVFGYCPSELESLCHGFSKHTESSGLSWLESDLKNEELVFLKSHHLFLIGNVPAHNFRAAHTSPERIFLSVAGCAQMPIPESHYPSSSPKKEGADLRLLKTIRFHCPNSLGVCKPMINALLTYFFEKQHHFC